MEQERSAGYDPGAKTGDATRAMGEGERGSERQPRYYRLEDPNGRNLFMVAVDEGWRTSIVCSGMYGWAADWLISVVQGKPYAPGRRP